MEAKENQLEVWGEMLGPKEIFPPMPVAESDALHGAFAPLKLKDLKATKEWTDATGATPIANFQAIRQLAKFDPPAMRYSIFIKCTCGESNFYPADAPSGKFVHYVCPDCMKLFTVDECRRAFKRGVDESIKRLCQSARQTPAPEQTQTPIEPGPSDAK